MVERNCYSSSGNSKKVPMTDVEFADNPEQRCACVLLLDTSGSMWGEKINALNNGIRKLKKALEDDDIASRRVELAVVTFDSSVNVISDFTTIDNFEPAELTASGATAMTKAIDVAVDLLEERKQLYKKNGMAYYKPWLFLITDGEPTDEDGYLLEHSDSRFKKAIKTLYNGVYGKHFTFFAVGVDDADMTTLSKLSPLSPPARLKDNKWGEMFQWLSSSLVTLSSSSMDQGKVNLPPIDSWGSVEI